MHRWFYDSWLWLLALAALLIAGLITVFIWLRLTTARRRTLAILRNISDRLLHNVVLPDGVGGHIGVDALLLRDGKLYVLMLRDAEGAIFGAENMDQWAAISHYRRFNFRNPLHLIRDQTLAVRTLVPELTIVPRIIFTRHARFPKGRPDGVELLEEFAKPLRRPEKVPISELEARFEIIWTNLREAAGVLPGKETSALSPG
ncbi:MAG TPA: NERD domain-containing protein [Gammaproteobacteria bacterium]|nr:NERD domain-containing protein [Gammaproteobacteria bacterium]